MYVGKGTWRLGDAMGVGAIVVDWPLNGVARLGEVGLSMM